MSALIFYTEPEQVLVVTDTLSAAPDGSPLLFTSKAHYVPHLRVIVAGTGIGGFSVEWALQVNSRMVLRGIENLDFHTPGGLRTLWSDYRHEYNLANGMTATVYQFGISEETGQMAAFAYRSANNFESERLGFGIGVKPECQVPEGNLLDHIQSMMNEQRAIQATKEPSDRVYIGGEAIAIHLMKDSCTFTRLFEFPDRRADEIPSLNHTRGSESHRIGEGRRVDRGCVAREARRRVDVPPTRRHW
jgi:hypothetical protein